MWFVSQTPIFGKTLNCKSFSDCLGNKTAACKTLNCSYKCTITTKGRPTCYCPPGRQPNGTLCQGIFNNAFFVMSHWEFSERKPFSDFNECSIEGICDQICTNTPGSYTCSCVSGYKAVKNRCFAINGKRILDLFSRVVPMKIINAFPHTSSIVIFQFYFILFNFFSANNG